MHDQILAFRNKIQFVQELSPKHATQKLEIAQEMIEFFEMGQINGRKVWSRDLENIIH